MSSISEDVKKLLRTWAVECKSIPANAKIFLFGSLVNDSGHLFDTATSDIDLITVIPDGLPVIDRMSILKALLEASYALEKELVVALKRQRADLPIVSNVVLTNTEAHYSIHKSGDRNLLSFSRFVALDTNVDNAVALSRGGDEASFVAQNSDQLSVIRECQARRNRFVSISVNRTRAFDAFNGLDAVPKDIRRLGAILAWNRGDIIDSKREDLIAGTSFIQRKIDSLSVENSMCSDLAETVARRRNTRGYQPPLTEDMMMMLYEILFEEALSQLRPSKRSLVDQFIFRLADTLKKEDDHTER